MRKRKTPFRVTRKGYPIDKVSIGKTIDPQIGFDNSYLEFEACIAAGLDIAKWTSFGYGSELKAKVIAWYLLKAQVENHVSDEQRKQQERENKRRKK